MSCFEVNVHIAIYIGIICIFNIFSEYTGPILSKLGIHDPWINSFHRCTKEGTVPSRGQKHVKLGQISKIVFSETEMTTIELLQFYL